MRPKCYIFQSCDSSSYLSNVGNHTWVYFSQLACSKKAEIKINALGNLIIESKCMLQRHEPTPPKCHMGASEKLAKFS